MGENLLFKRGQGESHFVGSSEARSSWSSVRPYGEFYFYFLFMFVTFKRKVTCDSLHLGFAIFFTQQCLSLYIFFL
jgi:hypothetical protein